MRIIGPKHFAAPGALVLALFTFSFALVVRADITSPDLLPTNEQLYGYLTGEKGQDEKMRPDQIFRLVRQGGFAGFTNEIIVVLYKKKDGRKSLMFFERKRVFEKEGSSIILKKYNNAMLPEEIKTGTLALLEATAKFLAAHKPPPLEQSGDDREDSKVSFYDQGKWTVLDVSPAYLEHDKALSRLAELSAGLQKISDAVFLLKRL